MDFDLEAFTYSLNVGFSNHAHIKLLKEYPIIKPLANGSKFGGIALNVPIDPRQESVADSAADNAANVGVIVQNVDAKAGALETSWKLPLDQASMMNEVGSLAFEIFVNKIYNEFLGKIGISFSAMDFAIRENVYFFSGTQLPTFKLEGIQDTNVVVSAKADFILVKK